MLREAEQLEFPFLSFLYSAEAIETCLSVIASHTNQ